MIRAVESLTTGDKNLDRVQLNIIRALSPIFNSDIVYGQVVENVDLTTSAAQFQHKLGRAIRGYIIIKKSSNATVWDSPSTDDSQFLRLQASSTVRVNLWVF